MNATLNDTRSIKDKPEPDGQAILYSNKLTDVIKEECSKSRGGIPFSRFMQLALYAPELGYYSGGLQKFGAAGDFITAPEVSPIFSQCVARQAAQVIGDLDDASMLEFGAGSGVMAADILHELDKLEQLPTHYYIVELSAELRERQQATIQRVVPHLSKRVAWLDALPEGFDGVIVANEVLDAMPVECFRASDDGFEQLMVCTSNGDLAVQYKDADAAFIEQVRTIEQRRGARFTAGYCSEFNPVLDAWIKELKSTLNKGMVLLIDYGYPVQEYYLDERSNGTLICHYQHRAHADPLWHPGLQDITAFVDFSAVAHAAVEAGFDVSGYTSQAMFLMSSGLEELHQAELSDDPKQQLLLAQQIKTLTLPSEMGERFKVMALTKDYDEPLMGFQFMDFRNRL